MLARNIVAVQHNNVSYQFSNGNRVGTVDCMSEWIATNVERKKKEASCVLKAR